MYYACMYCSVNLIVRFGRMIYELLEVFGRFLDFLVFHGGELWKLHGLGILVLG